MNVTAWVDVAIGLSLVYLGASLFVTVINEQIAQALNLRGRQLRAALNTLFSDDQVRKLLSSSPTLQPFFASGAGKPPSYVDSNVLARLLIGGLADRSVAGDTAKQVSATIDQLPDSDLKTQLQALVSSAGNATDAVVKAVCEWVERSLTMLGEGYKRNLQMISLGIGLGVAAGLNIDTVSLTEHLYRDKEARSAVVEVAVQMAGKTGRESFEKCMALAPKARVQDASCAQLGGLVDAVQRRNESLGKLPIGWPLADVPAQATSSHWANAGRWAVRVLGWLLTALALALGAPFWFDLLNKLINMRYGMRKPEAKA